MSMTIEQKIVQKDREVVLTNKRLFYNLSKVDFRYGRIKEHVLKKRRKEWVDEYLSEDYTELLKRRNKRLD